MQFRTHDTYSNNFVPWSDATIRKRRFTDQGTNIMAQNTLILLPQGETKTVIDFGQHDVKFLHKQKSELKYITVESGYNDTGLSHTSSITIPVYNNTQNIQSLARRYNGVRLYFEITVS